MRNIILIIALLIVVPVLAHSQTPLKPDSELKTVELYSPWRVAGVTSWNDPALHEKSCFDLLLLERRCGGSQMMSYGNRINKHWDIFSILDSGDSLTRMVDLGKYNWGDKFDVAAIKPWPELKPGENRTLVVKGSLFKEKGGKNAKSTDPDTYQPFTEATKGHMYAVHVVDLRYELYLLIHADDVVRGTKVTISFKKLGEPMRRLVF
jgi:hypothetical protein